MAILLILTLTDIPILTPPPNTHTHTQSNTASAAAGGSQKLQVNPVQLQRAWDVSQRSTADDWTEWLRRLTSELLRESSSPCLRACAAMVQSYAPLGKELFHAAFVSCWQELSEQYQENLVKALNVAFASATIPPEILQILLNLAEYLEHDFEALPISPSILAELAQKSHAYAKALHYRELEFQHSPATCFESLININKKLDQYDAAIGVLKVVSHLQQKMSHHGIGIDNSYIIQESWLAKLGQWNEALKRYDQRLALNPLEVSAITGKLKCLDALGRWDEAVALLSENLELLRGTGNNPSASGGLNPGTASQPQGQAGQPGQQQQGQQELSQSVLAKAAVIGARAAWSLNEWELMESFVSELDRDNTDACLMRAVLSVHSEDYMSSAIYIDQTRQQLCENLVALLTESYGRAYVPMIKIQQCAELEEILEYKLLLREAAGVTGSVKGTPSSSHSGTPEISGGSYARQIGESVSIADLQTLLADGGSSSSSNSGSGSGSGTTNNPPYSPRRYTTEKRSLSEKRSFTSSANLRVIQTNFDGLSQKVTPTSAGSAHAQQARKDSEEDGTSQL